MNTGGVDYCVIGNGPYRYQNWDYVTQTATLEKFTNWGGTDNNSLWNKDSYSGQYHPDLFFHGLASAPLFEEKILYAVSSILFPEYSRITS